MRSESRLYLTRPGIVYVWARKIRWTDEELRRHLSQLGHRALLMAAGSIRLLFLFGNLSTIFHGLDKIGGR